MSQWPPAIAQLHLALEAQLLLAPLRRSLGLHGDRAASERADVDLLSTLRNDAQLASAVLLLRRDDTATLAQAITARWPANLDTRIVHHLAVAWLDSPRRQAALRGLFYLWAFRRNELEAIATPTSDPASAASAADALPAKLLAGELAAIQALATPGEQRSQIAEAVQRLTQTEAWLAEAAAPASSLETLRSLRLRARAVAIQNTLEHLRELVEAAEALPAGDAQLRHTFTACAACAGLLGHDEQLTVRVLEEAVRLSWPRYHGNDNTGVRLLLEPVPDFVDDLETRLRTGEAFGQQGLFSDVLVMQSQCLPGASQLDASDASLALVAKQQAMLSRALALNPIHRNTRVCLASAQLNHARILMTRTQTLSGARKSALLDEAAKLIEAARTVRPEHPQLVERERDLASLDRRRRRAHP